MKTLILLVIALALFGSCKAKEKAPKEQAMASPHGHAAAGVCEGQGMAHPRVVAEEMEIGTVEKAAGGVTISEIFQSQDEFQGKAVLVRAKVVKASYGIMGRTWLHVRDGTGAEGGNELVVTTEETPKRGDLVLVRGTFTKEKDLGMGHRFHGIVEDAGVTLEK